MMQRLTISVLLVAISSVASSSPEVRTGVDSGLWSGVPTGVSFSGSSLDNYVVQAWGDSISDDRASWCGSTNHRWEYPTYCQQYGLSGQDTDTIVTALVAELTTPTGLIHPNATWFLLSTGAGDWTTAYTGTFNEEYTDRLATAVVALKTNVTACARPEGCYKPLLWDPAPICDPVVGTADCDEYWDDNNRHAGFQAALAAISAAANVPIVRMWDTFIPYFDGPGGETPEDVYNDHVHFNSTLGAELAAQAVKDAIGYVACDNVCCGNDIPPQDGLVYWFEPSWGMKSTAAGTRLTPLACSGPDYSIATRDRPTTVEHTCSDATIVQGGLPSERDTLLFGANGYVRSTVSDGNYPVAGHLPEGAHGSVSFTMAYVSRDNTGPSGGVITGLAFGSPDGEVSASGARGWVIGARSGSYAWGDALSNWHHNRRLSDGGSLLTPTADPDPEDNAWHVQILTGAADDGELRFYVNGELAVHACHELDQSARTTETNNTPALGCQSVRAGALGITVERGNAVLGFPIWLDGTTTQPDAEVGAAFIYNKELIGDPLDKLESYIDRCVLGN